MHHRRCCEGARLEPGTHVINVGGGGRLDAASLARVDVYLRFGNAPAADGLDGAALDDEYLTWSVRAAGATDPRRRRHERAAAWRYPPRWSISPSCSTARSRAARRRREVTWSERGNLQGAQFHAVAGRAYELARAAGMGREIPTEWFLQDIRD